MLQLAPREFYTIARGLEDHADSNTYYVQAVIRNARTDALIETVQLADNGDRRFTKAWQVPADTSGQGFYILITTTVYTDAGYTTKSELYGEKFDTYLVQDRVNPFLIGGGGGADIDYKRITGIIREELARLPQPEKVEIPETDFTQIIQALAEIKGLIGKIEFPVPEKAVFDYERILRAVSDKEIPETDLEPVIGAINDATDKWEASKDEMSALLDNIRGFFTKDVEQIMGVVSELKQEFDRIPYFERLVTNKKQNEPERNIKRIL